MNCKENCPVGSEQWTESTLSSSPTITDAGWREDNTTSKISARRSLETSSDSLVVRFCTCFALAFAEQQISGDSQVTVTADGEPVPCEALQRLCSDAVEKATATADKTDAVAVSALKEAIDALLREFACLS